MRLLILPLSAMLVVPSAVQARPTRSDCKAIAKSVEDLAKEFELTPELTGRELFNTVEAWLADKDPRTIKRFITRIEEATGGVQRCEAGGLAIPVRRVKGLSRKLETAVLPWLRNATAVDSCQSLINQAARKLDQDFEGAVADLERCVRECDDPTWLPEAHRRLAEMYFERGDLERDDYARGREQIRGALRYQDEYEGEDRKTFLAIFAKPTIEAGAKLMQQREYAEARRHWAEYSDLFGGPGFDVLFTAGEVAQGSWRLRELKSARYQRSLACIEVGDLACVSSAASAALAERPEELQPVKNLTIRAFRLAAETAEAEKEGYYALAFDLLTLWHEYDPDSYEIDSMLDAELLALPRGERLARMRLTDHCWIPLRVAERLKHGDKPFIEEVELAASCGGSGAEARRMLADFYKQAAHDRLDRLDALARTVQDKRAMLREVEEKLLPKIDDRDEAEKIRSRLAQERARLREQQARTEQERANLYAGCTDLLATIQWNIRREEDYYEEELEFKRSCCGFLRANSGGWLNWMRSRPERERLADAEIENKNRLMQRYCAPRGN